MKQAYIQICHSLQIHPSSIGKGKGKKKQKKLHIGCLKLQKQRWLRLRMVLNIVKEKRSELVVDAICYLRRRIQKSNLVS